MWASQAGRCRMATLQQPHRQPTQTLMFKLGKSPRSEQKPVAHLTPDPLLSAVSKKKKTQTLKIRIISIFPDRILYQRNAKSYFNDVDFVATVQEIQLSFYSEETSVRLKQKLNTVKPEGDRHLLAWCYLHNWAGSDWLVSSERNIWYHLYQGGKAQIKV